ncbi:MAG: hypothetical protein INR73_26340, partial [Williamsia sp.]|nr:hypothetical protein [Williamsia sp.]
MTKPFFLLPAISLCLFCQLSCSSSKKVSNPPAEQKKTAPATALVSNYEGAMIGLPPDSLKLDPFYKKWADAFGIPIVSSHQVPDAALLMARDIVNFMLSKRPDVRTTLISRKARVLVMAQTEMETDLPERSNWKKPT